MEIEREETGGGVAAKQRDSEGEAAEMSQALTLSGFPTTPSL